MNASQWIDTYGVPQNWALATAILEQIESYRAATRTLIEGPRERTKVSLTRAFGMSDEQYRTAAIDQARQRVSKPVIDITAAQAKATDIEQSGGWAQFVPNIMESR